MKDRNIARQLHEIDEQERIHQKIEGTTAEALMQMEFPEMKWIIEPILPEGVTLFGGKPKEGKSVAVTNISLGVALGGKALGVDVERGGVIYLHLEDNQRRLQHRIGCMLPFDNYTGCQAPAPGNLHLFHKWPRAGDGGLRALDEFLTGEPDVRLVVIDTLKKFQATARDDRTKSGYDFDYEKVEPLRNLYEKHNVAILIVTHTRKSDSEDAVDLISGTLGLTGGVDNYIIMRGRKGNRAKLYTGGRDINPEEFTLEYSPEVWTWNLLGPASQVMATDNQQAVLDFISESTQEEGQSKGVTLKDIIAAVDVKKSNLQNRVLPRLLELGRIAKAEHGVYYAIPA